MKVTVELAFYEMKKLFLKETPTKAALFAKNIIDRYCNGEYLCEDRFINED